MFIDEISYLHENSTHYIMIYNNLPYGICKETDEEPYAAQLQEIKEGIATNKLKLQTISNDEWDNIISSITGMPVPPKTSQEQIVRFERNKLLNEADTLLLKYDEQVELGAITANETYKLDLLKYKQALRDIPEQAEFPDNVVFPELPVLQQTNEIIENKITTSETIERL